MRAPVIRTLALLAVALAGAGCASEGPAEQPAVPQVSAPPTGAPPTTAPAAPPAPATPPDPAPSEPEVIRPVGEADAPEEIRDWVGVMREHGFRTYAVPGGPSTRAGASATFSGFRATPDDRPLLTVVASVFADPAEAGRQRPRGARNPILMVREGTVVEIFSLPQTDRLLAGRIRADLRQAGYRDLT